MHPTSESNPDPTHETPQMPPTVSAGEARHIIDTVSQVVQSGLPLPAGLRALAAESLRGSTSVALKDLAATMEQGRPWTPPACEAGDSRANVVRFLIAAHRTGRLGEALAKVLQLHRHVTDQRREISQALAYPCIVTLLAAAMILIWVALAVPSYVELTQEIDSVQQGFSGTSGQASGLSEVGESLTQSLRLQGMLVSGMFVSAVVVTWASCRYAANVAGWGRWWSAVPVLGRFVEWQGSQEFSCLMAIALEQKLTLESALQFAATGMETRYLADEVTRLASDSRAGQGLSRLLSSDTSFPPSLVHWVSWGERIQDVPDALHAAADLFAQRAALRVLWVRTVLPHFISINVMIVTFGFVVAVVRPMVKLLNFLS